MFCGNHLIKIYLMILIIVFSLHYYELKESTILERLVLGSKMKDIINHLGRRKRTDYYKHLNLLDMIRKRNQKLMRYDQSLKHKFDEEILRHNIQLLQDETKKSILKLQNSYLENFFINDPKNKNLKAMNSETTIQNSIKITEHTLRRRRDYGTASAINDNFGNKESAVCNDDEEGIAAESNKQLLAVNVEDINEIRENNVGLLEKYASIMEHGSQT